MKRKKLSTFNIPSLSNLITELKQYYHQIGKLYDTNKQNIKKIGEKYYSHGAEKEIWETNDLNLLCITYKGLIYDRVAINEQISYAKILLFYEYNKDNYGLICKIPRIYIESNNECNFYVEQIKPIINHFKITNEITLQDIKGKNITEIEIEEKYIYACVDFLFILYKINMQCTEFEVLYDNKNFSFIDFGRCHSFISMRQDIDISFVEKIQKWFDYISELNDYFKLKFLKRMKILLRIDTEINKDPILLINYQVFKKTFNNN